MKYIVHVNIDAVFIDGIFANFVTSYNYDRLKKIDISYCFFIS